MDWGVIGGFFTTIFETLFGKAVDRIGSKRQSKPRLCFKMTGTPDSELTEKGFRTKTSPSEYSIEIYNVGQAPVILEQFSLSHKCGLWIDCFIEDQEKIIQPYERKVYTMMEQEANSLEWHCKKGKFEQCDVIAIDIEGKRIKSKMDVSWVALRVRLSPEDMIVTESK